MPKADFYLDRIDFTRYIHLPNPQCRDCGALSCRDFADRLSAREIGLSQCPHITENLRYAFSIALGTAEAVDPPEVSLHPRPLPPELIMLNEPDEESPVLVSGNAEHTVTFLSHILGTTSQAFYYLIFDTLGDTVDMSVILESFSAERLARQIKSSGLAEKVVHRKMILPGFCSALADPIEKTTGFKAEIGPLCGAELPLYLSHLWIRP